MPLRITTFLSRPEVALGLLAVAAFLTLYWLLRGAPPGQAVRDEPGSDAPGPGYRDRVSAAAVLAVLLVGAGACVALGASVPWSVPLFVGGFGGLVALIRANRPYRHDSPGLRRVVAFADTALTASLVGGILVVGNVLAFKYGERPIDFTREHAFSLESLTVNQLKSLDRPLRFTAFYGQNPRVRRQLDRIVQLLELYRAEAPAKVRFEVVHPYNNPAEYEALQARAPGVALTPGGGVLLEYGEGGSAERVVVPNNDLFEAAPRGESGPMESTFRGEDALTSALVRLREAKKTRIGLVTGHGEPSIHDMDPARPGLGLLRARLETLGVQVVVYNPAAERPPADLAVMIAAGARTPYQPNEVARLREYVQAGGRLVLLVDGRGRTGFEDWLRTADVQLVNEPIVDPRFNFRNSWLLPLAPIVGDVLHAIVEPLRNQYPVLPEATPLLLGLEGRKADQPGAFAATAILRSSPSSWSETDPQQRPPTRDLEKKDRPGPLVVGAALSSGQAEPGGMGPRMVVFSSPMLADNRVVALDPTNLDLVVNSVNWLRGRPDLQGIAPRRHTALSLPADPGLRSRLVFLPTVMACAVIVGLGVMTYLARRS